MEGFRAQQMVCKSQSWQSNTSVKDAGPQQSYKHVARPCISSARSELPRTGNKEGVCDLGAKQVAAAAREQESVGPLAAGEDVSSVAVCDEVSVGEGAHSQDPPGSVPGVHSNGIQGVIPLQAADALR